MSDSLFDLHRSPVIIQQFLVIERRVHGLHPFFEPVIRPFLLNDSTLGVDHVARSALPITEINRLSEDICRFDGFYLPHYFRVLLGDLQALRIELQRIIIEMPLDDGLLCLILSLSEQIGLSV